MSLKSIKNKILAVKDYPKEGIIFRDITPLLADNSGMKEIIEIIKERIEKDDLNPTVIAGMESRGFIFGVPLAYELGLGFVPIRKPGKLPRDVYSCSYDLEYGQDSLEIHQDAFSENDRVLIIDDLLATGGTAEASAKVVVKTGAKIEGIFFIIELPELHGRDKIKNYHIDSLVEF